MNAQRPRQWVYLLVVASVAALSQLPALFFGVELCDSGFYMTFYRWALSNPESVEYNWMYPLTGIAGGAFHSLPGCSNMFAMRLLGIGVNTLAALFAVALISRRCTHRRLPAMAGIIMILAATWRYPLTFYYDHLSCMMAIAGIFCMGLALTEVDGSKGSVYKMLCAGFIIGINTYSRIPNVVDIIFIAAIPIYCRIAGRKNAGSLSAMFAGGWLAGILIGFWMVWNVAGESFTNIMKELFSIGASKSDEASHSAINLIMAQISAWKEILTASLIFATALTALVGIRALKTRFLKITLLISVCLASAYIINRMSMVTLTAAFSFTGCIYILIWRRNDRTLLFCALTGLLMMTAMSIGSDGGIYNPGTIVLWGAAPAAASAFAENRQRYYTFDPAPGAGAIWLFTALMVIVAIKGVIRHGVYFDDTPLQKSTAQLHSKSMAGITTSPERAKILDHIATTAAPHLIDADQLMVYGSGPLLNYLLDKQPAFGNSWPEQLSAKTLEKHFAEARTNRHKALPYVMILKFKTIGASDFSPAESYLRGDDEHTNIYHNRTKSTTVLDAVSAPPYRCIVSDKYYNLYAPM